VRYTRVMRCSHYSSLRGDVARQADTLPRWRSPETPGARDSCPYGELLAAAQALGLRWPGKDREKGWWHPSLLVL